MKITFKNNTVVRAAIMYRSEYWILNINEEIKMKISERKILK